MIEGEVKLGAALFSCVNYDEITVLNEHYIMKLMRETGLDRVLPMGEEPDAQYLARLHAALIDTLKLPDVLAGYLLPMGKTEADFTEAMAKDTANFIRQLTRKEDKAEVHRLGLAVCMDFFRAGLASLGIFQKSGNEATTIRPTSEAMLPAKIPPTEARST